MKNNDKIDAIMESEFSSRNSRIYYQHLHEYHDIMQWKAHLHTLKIERGNLRMLLAMSGILFMGGAMVYKIILVDKEPNFIPEAVAKGFVWILAGLITYQTGSVIKLKYKNDRNIKKTKKMLNLLLKLQLYLKQEDQFISSGIELENIEQFSLRKLKKIEKRF